MNIRFINRTLLTREELRVDVEGGARGVVEHKRVLRQAAARDANVCVLQGVGRPHREVAEDEHLGVRRGLRRGDGGGLSNGASGLVQRRAGRDRRVADHVHYNGAAQRGGGEAVAVRGDVVQRARARHDAIERAAVDVPNLPGDVGVRGRCGGPADSQATAAGRRLRVRPCARQVARGLQALGSRARQRLAVLPVHESVVEAEGQRDYVRACGGVGDEDRRRGGHLDAVGVSGGRGEGDRDGVVCVNIGPCTRTREKVASCMIK